MKGRPEPMARVNGSSNGSVDSSTETESEAPMYMAAQPKLSKQYSAFASILRHGQPTKIEAAVEKYQKMTWQQKLSMILVAILWRLNKYLKLLGFIVEWTLNLLNLNGGPFGLLYKVFLLKWGDIILPQPDSDTYLSLIALIDSRSTLFVDTSQTGKADSTRADTVAFPAENVGSRSTADVCVMAAKVAYESPAVIEKVVTQGMKMHFVKFFNCWNEYQQMKNTQAFVFMDKPKNANAVVVAFRGTECFNGYDWSTDVDFSWVRLQDLGGVHLGFLEALGLGTRDSISTFVKMRKNANESRSKTQTQENEEAAIAPPNTPRSPHHKLKPEILATTATSGLSQEVIDDPDKVLAYDEITKQVSMLLLDNPNAKLFVTGHSLGGALAALYSTMLHFTGETEVASKIGAVYTFGQPRVGDQDFADYANSVLKGKYFRVVYCNDVVPRVPFDNDLFSFRHFGDCAYFNSVYDGLKLQEEPNRNFFGVRRLLTMHLNAAWEVVQGALLMPLQHGDEFRETKVSFVYRLVGLVLPGIAGHSPTNYVNSMRLGPLPLKERLKGDIADAAEEFHLMHDNLKDIAYIVVSALPALPGSDVVSFAAQKIFNS
ncbi:hypothetical protein KC19_3G080000 [Ceratodon purpureus]|uniref:Fungal lipase-type domain-containing protein n=1 Tax=Ceratodon purpureus TaxID=3225 RepID=A0A8T0IJJ5_CERPU|nr:hypothetical protein KC19_3G080000 [Ceratodon purpureus]